ncbi:uncharacterized protein LOC129724582 [Wyeomyia smithii]|uniref:uncharacterized protein LOC129724582 n=1 Tax=Wyeomyia smithii TaxID=174621 RepID=UPI00246822AE|nr:uncharacterized protein LOC129724582 [Wyeomyia smithii]
MKTNRVCFLNMDAKSVLFTLFILIILQCQCIPLHENTTEEKESYYWSELSKHYVNYDDVSFSKELNPEPETEIPGLPDAQTVVKRSLHLSPENDKIQLEADDAVETDLEVAESHLFRPVFRYKSQYAERRRVRQVPSQLATRVLSNSS